MFRAINTSTQKSREALFMVVLFCVLFFGQEAKAINFSQLNGDYKWAQPTNFTSFPLVNDGQGTNGTQNFLPLGTNTSGIIPDNLTMKWDGDSTVTARVYFAEYTGSASTTYNGNWVRFDFPLTSSVNGLITTSAATYGGSWNQNSTLDSTKYYGMVISMNTSSGAFPYGKNSDSYNFECANGSGFNCDINFKAFYYNFQQPFQGTNFFNSEIVYGISPQYDSVTSSTTVNFLIGFKKGSVLDPFYFYGIEIQNLTDGFNIDTSGYVYGPDYATIHTNSNPTGIPFSVKNLTASQLYQYRAWGSATSSMADRYATSTIYGNWIIFSVVGRAAFFSSAIGTSTQSVTASTSPIGYTYNQVKEKCKDAMGEASFYNVGYDLCLFAGLILFPSETTLANFRSIPQEVFNKGPFQIIGDTINWFKVLGTNPGTASTTMNIIYQPTLLSGMTKNYVVFNLSTIAGYAPIITFRLIFSYLLWFMFILYAFKYLESII